MRPTCERARGRVGDAVAAGVRDDRVDVAADACRSRRTPRPRAARSAAARSRTPAAASTPSMQKPSCAHRAGVAVRVDRAGLDAALAGAPSRELGARSGSTRARRRCACRRASCRRSGSSALGVCSRVVRERLALVVVGAAVERRRAQHVLARQQHELAARRRGRRCSGAASQELLARVREPVGLVGQHARAEAGDLAVGVDEAGVAERAVGVADRRIAAAQLHDVERLDAGVAERARSDRRAACRRRRRTSARADRRAVDVAESAVDATASPRRSASRSRRRAAPRRSGNSRSRTSTGAANSSSETGMLVLVGAGAQRPGGCSAARRPSRSRHGAGRQRRVVGAPRRARPAVVAGAAVRDRGRRCRRSASPLVDRVGGAGEVALRQPSRSWCAMSSGIGDARAASPGSTTSP